MMLIVFVQQGTWATLIFHRPEERSHPNRGDEVHLANGIRDASSVVEASCENRNVVRRKSTSQSGAGFIIRDPRLI